MHNDKQPSLDTAGNMADPIEKFSSNSLFNSIDRLEDIKATYDVIRSQPSIVVVGDQSSGKSSVVESLATICLRRGKGRATRVPLVLRLESCRGFEDSSTTISYKDTVLNIKEDEIESQVEAATNILAGTGKGVVTDSAISLYILKPDAPDLTMIDLPGITPAAVAAVRGEAVDISEPIAAMIRKYLEAPDTVILNVVSATSDFSTCESSRMSREEDKKGERTLTVITKVDRVPGGVYKKLTADVVNLGLGYVCVRNRIADESHEEAREQERAFFEKHPSLSQLDKCSVGIPSLVERLTQIQANIICQRLPGIQYEIGKAVAAHAP